MSCDVLTSVELTNGEVNILVFLYCGVECALYVIPLPYGSLVPLLVSLLCYKPCYGSINTTADIAAVLDQAADIQADMALYCLYDIRIFFSCDASKNEDLFHKQICLNNPAHICKHNFD